MRRYLIHIFLILIFSCSEKSNPINYSDSEIQLFIEIAWNDLSPEEFSTVIVTKEESKIYYSKINRVNGIYYYKIDDSEYTFEITHPEIDFRTKQTFVIVQIQTSDDVPITVIIEPNTRQVFGRGSRY